MLITHPGGGAGGLDDSRLQVTSLGMTTLGAGAQQTVPNRVADDFVVPAGGWSINEIEVYTYQTGSTTTSTLTGITFQIWNGPPNAGGTVVFGDTTTNRQTSTAFTNIFRTSETSVGNTTRPIMSITASGLDIDLPAGTYWLDWSMSGTLASGPWAPPITILGTAVTGNALQSQAGVWANLLDGGTGTPAQGLPITIRGTLGSSAPQFAYSPAAGSTVTFAGGGAIGSTGTASIAVSVATAGVGTGAAATTTTTCTAPTAPFTGFGQTVTAEGTGAISGSPLTGTCTLGAAAVTQTLTCSENRGGTPTAVTFNLECPAGTATPLTSTPVSGSTVSLATQILGGPASNATVAFQNPGLVDATVTCTAPVAPEFTVTPLSFTVPAAGSASTTVSYSSATIGAFTGVLTCTSGAQTFTFNLAGSTNGAATAVPALDGHSRSLMILAMLALGLIAVGLYRRS